MAVHIFRREATCYWRRRTPRVLTIYLNRPHWTQQERPAEVSAAIIEFLRSLPKKHRNAEPAKGSFWRKADAR